MLIHQILMHRHRILFRQILNFSKIKQMPRNNGRTFFVELKKVSTFFCLKFIKRAVWNLSSKSELH